MFNGIGAESAEKGAFAQAMDLSRGVVPVLLVALIAGFAFSLGGFVTGQISQQRETVERIAKLEKQVGLLVCKLDRPHCDLELLRR